MRNPVTLVSKQYQKYMYISIPLYCDNVILWKSTTSFAVCIVTSAQYKALVVSLIL